MSQGYPTVVIAAKKNKKELHDQLKDALTKIIGLDTSNQSLDSMTCPSNRRLHLHDWGGVIQIADEKFSEGARLSAAVRTDDHFVFSFTPWNEKGREELPRMADVAAAAGMRAMIVMTKKRGQCGKASTFAALQEALPTRPISYYEDTFEVLQECAQASTPEMPLDSQNVRLFHVLNPDHPVSKADKKIMEGLVVNGTQEDYLGMWESAVSTKTE
jgi:hypothetical protein